MFHSPPPKRYLFSILAFLAVALAIGLTLRWPSVASAVQTVSNGNPVTAAWEKARASGSYHFVSDVTQLTIPTTRISNVGRSSRSQQLHLEGQNDLRRQGMEMQLWTDGGNIQQAADSVGIKIADGKSYMRQGSGAWQEKPDFSLDTVAPQGDFMAYLVAMRNVKAHAPESRNGIPFTRYSFTIDGPSFARHIHQQMEATLRAKGELPANMSLEIPRYYQEMTGDGELWIGENGLPLRQVLTLQFPAQKNEQVNAQIVTDFSNFGPPAAAPLALLRAGDLRGLLATLAQSAGTFPAALPPYLLLATLLFGVLLLIRYRRARVLEHAVVITVISSMLLGPVLTTMTQVRFFDTQSAKAAARDEQQATVDQEQSARDALGKVTFDPHKNPVEVVESGRVEEWKNGTVEQSPNLPISTQALPNDSTLDTDKDGLSDFVEERVGTSLVISDTDSDGLTDNLEVRGFSFAGKQWYLNADAPDSNGDGQGDLLEWGLDANGSPLATPQDTDGDGTPDLFDPDNDNDGVPDGKDMAPYRLMKAAAGGAAYFNEATPFKLTVNNLAANTPVFVDFQIRPKDPKHLWFAYNVLDWPQDADGQVRDVDNKTFADLSGAAGSNGANGDLKLTPMLEIRISGATTNLPPQSVLNAYNVTLNNYTADGSSKILYVPLSIINDEQSGQRVAFNGRMRYNAAGSWPTPHDIRLAWVVQGLVDLPCDPQDAQAVAQGCQSDGYIHNVQQVLHSYYDDFSLTGISVREDRGASQAILYEDPAVDSAKKDDFALWALSDGLNERFLGGVIDLNEVVRRFNRTTNSGVSTTERWSIPNTLRVEKQDYPTFDEAVITTAMTETKRILNSQFTSSWQADNSIKPFLLFAHEQRFRAVGLDAVASPTGNALVLDFSAGGQPSEVQTVAGVKATPYCASAGSSPTWDSCEPDLYWTELEQRHLNAAALPGDSDPDLKLGRMMSTEIYFLSLLQGATSVTKIGVRSVSARYSLRTDTQIESDVRVFVNVALGTGVPAIANFIVMGNINTDKGLATKLLGGAWKSIQRIGLGIPSAKSELAKIAPGIKNLIKKNPGKTIAATAVTLAVSGLVSGLLTGLPENDLGQKIVIKIATVSVVTVLSVVMPILDVVDAVNVLKAGQVAGAASKVLNMSSELVGSSRTAGAIGAVLAVGITWGFFIYSMVSNHVSAFSPEFNRGLAETIAATIYIIILSIISATVIGNILVAIVAVIDAILTAICELGVDELRTVPGLGGACFTLGTAAVKVIAYLFYNYDLMVDTSRSDLMVTGAPKVTLADSSKGYAAGNSVTVALPITTTVTHKDPDPSQGLMIYFYEYFFSESNVRSSTVKYSLSKSDAPQTLTAVRDEMTNVWSSKVAFSSNRGAYSKDFYSAQANTSPAPVSGIALEAGINKPAAYYLNQGYAYPAYECWAAPNPIIPFFPPIPVCYVRTFDGNSSTKMEELKYDVYPATLDGFMTLVSKGDGGVGLAWDAAFPSLKDADGDGLLSGAYNGLDPNDTLFDSDNDGLSDANELERRQNGEPYSPISCDSDLDGLTDEQEMQLDSNPGIADSDNDGLKDGEELWHRVYTVSTVGNQTTCTATNNWAGGWDVRINATSPFVVHVSSNPKQADSDGDGISDLAEKQLAESTCTAQEVANGRKCEGNPLKPVDKANQPYHPNVVNAPPLAVTVELDDFDGYLLPGQTLRYTSTAVATAPMAPSVLDVTHPSIAGASPAPALLPFNPVSFNGSQTVTVPSLFTVQSNATTQRATITSTARARLASSTGAAWVFDPVVLEPALGGFTSPFVARNTGLSANRSDRTDSYLLSALLSAASTAGGTGDIQAYSLPSGTNRALDADNNNRNIFRGANPPRSATNSRGDSLVVWDQVENCRILNITLLSITQFAPDHVTSGIEPFITVRDSVGNQDVRVWNWTSVQPADLGVGTYSQGFPVTVNVCGDYTITMWESGNASGGDTLLRAQTLSQNTEYNLTLSMGAGETHIFIDVNTPLRDRYTISGALVAPDGTIKKRFATWPRITSPAGVMVRSVNPVVASNGDGFVVVYEQSQESANSTAEHFVMSQGIDRDGNLLSTSSVSVGSVNYDVGRGLEQDIVWMGDRYRVAMKGVKLDTINVADFAADGTRTGPFSLLTNSSFGNNIFNSAPSLAWDPVSGRWAIAYPLDASIEIRRYPIVNTLTPDLSKSLPAFPNQVKLAWNPQNRGWLVASDAFVNNQANRQLFFALDADLEQRANNANQTSWLTPDIPGNALICPVVTAMPVLELRMEELPGATSFVDSSGRGNNAICGSATQCPTAGVPGGVDASNIAIGTPASDYALSFNTSQYLRVPNNASLNFDATRSFTWLTWVKTTVGSPIMRKGLGGANDLLLSITTDTGRLRMGFGNINTNTLTATAPDLRDNKWHQVAVTLDRATGTATLYVDGTARGSGTFTGSFVTNDALFIGSSNAAGYSGALDNLQIYHAALAADTISALYKRELQTYCVSSSPTQTGNGIQWAKLKVHEADLRGGTVTTSGSTSFIVDGDKPTVSLTSLQDGEIVLGRNSTTEPPSVIIIGGSASDVTSGVGKVEVRINNGAWELATGAETWAYALTVFAGSYRIETRVTDLVGNVTVNSPVTIHTDYRAPQMTMNAIPQIIRPQRNDEGRFFITLTGAVSDAADQFESGIAAGSVQVQLVDAWGRALTAPQVATLTGGTWRVDYLLPDGEAASNIVNIDLFAADKVGHSVKQRYTGQPGISDARVWLDRLGPNAALVSTNVNNGSLSSAITTTVTIGGRISDTYSSPTAPLINFTPLQQVLPYNDVVLLLNLEEKAGERFFEDSSIELNHARCGSTTQCPTAGGAGRNGLGLSFSGNQYLRVRNHPTLNFDTNSSFSWQAWVKTNSNLATNPIMRKGLGNSADLMLAINSSGQALMGFGNISSSTLSAGANLRDNQWHQIIVTLDRTNNRANLYVDGVGQGGGTFTGNFTTADDLLVGSGNFQGFVGTLDNVAIFRHALSAAEVQALYQSASRSSYPATLLGSNIYSRDWRVQLPAGLEGIYQIDAPAADSAGNGAPNSNLWRGLIDNVVPRVTISGTATGQSVLDANNVRQYEVKYSCVASDWQLDESKFNCPGNSSQPASRGFNTDPILQSQFPTLTLLSTLSNTWTVWQPSNVPSGSLTACDTTGKCATATLGSAVAAGGRSQVAGDGVATGEAFSVAAAEVEAVPSEQPKAEIINPTDGSFVGSTGVVEVGVAAEAAKTLREVNVLLDGEVVATIPFARIDKMTIAQQSVSIPMPAGEHTLEARASDWSGNVQPAGKPVRFTVVSKEPTVALGKTNLTLSDTYQAQSGIVLIQGTVDNVDNLASVQVKVGDQPYADALVKDGVWGIAYPVSDPENRNLAISVRAIDKAGQISKIGEAATTDFASGVLPETSITAQPGNGVNASIGFTGTVGNEVANAFECKLDEEAFTVCSTPVEYKNLSNGEHTFQVHALNGQGTQDPTPAEVKWTVNGGGIAVQINDKPAAETTSRTASFEFSGGGEYECSLDGAAFTTCASPATYSDLTDGTHTFQVRVKGNPASKFVWKVTNSAPLATSMVVTTAQNVSLPVALKASDESSLKYIIISKPANGTLSGTGANITYQPGTDFFGTDSFSFKADDGDATSNLATVTINVTPTPGQGGLQRDGFVVYGQEGVILRENVKVMSGDIAASIASDGPWLGDGAEVSIGKGVTFADAKSKVMGDSLFVGPGTALVNAHYNELRGPGSVSGNKVTPQALPLLNRFVAMPGIGVGKQNVDVASAGSATVAPGNYLSLNVAKGGEVTFSGGVYSFKEWNVAENTKLYFAAASEIRISGRAIVGEHGYVGPAPSSAVSAKQIVIYVAGVNANTAVLGGLGAKAATFGPYATLAANVVVPNGTLLIRERSKAVGSFVARWVSVGKFSELTLANRFDASPVEGRVDGYVNLTLDDATGIHSTAALSPDVDDELLSEEGANEENPEATLKKLFLPVISSGASGTVDSHPVDAAPEGSTPSEEEQTAKLYLPAVSR